MEINLHIYNSLSRQKEKFIPINPPYVGMYVCGPTVYGPPHLGHARPYITFDVLRRYLEYLGLKVRYVRNITDVGHLENDLDEGEDKIAKKARLEQLEPMEVVELYTRQFHEAMHLLNNKPVSIEPRASGHIIEQIEMIEQIIKNGYAYVSNGSVYFDVEKYAQSNAYGELSGRVLEELIAGAGEARRTLDGQDEKRNRADFALWKKASPEHIMRWNSPWSVGFPGWHIECSAMGTKYLGETFDIHGGGMDLLFPHHEAEIAQSKACHHKAPVKYWMHCNMITIEGQKMGKSLGNFINLEQFFTGSHPKLTQAYSPMAIRFFMLQAHYRSTLDFSNEGLQAAEKALQKILQAYPLIHKIKVSDNSNHNNIQKLLDNCLEALNDDLNTAIVLSNIFEAVRIINSAYNEQLQITQTDKDILQKIFDDIFFGILGLCGQTENNTDNISNELMSLIIELRKEAKDNKNYALSDSIRNKLNAIGIELKDTKEGTEWKKI
jgi:cysteinyl-tRNA synthetase